MTAQWDKSDLRGQAAGLRKGTSPWVDRVVPLSPTVVTAPVPPYKEEPTGNPGSVSHERPETLELMMEEFIQGPLNRWEKKEPTDYAAVFPDKCFPFAIERAQAYRKYYRHYVRGHLGQSGEKRDPPPPGSPSRWPRLRPRKSPSPLRTLHQSYLPYDHRPPPHLRGYIVLLKLPPA